VKPLPWDYKNTHYLYRDILGDEYHAELSYARSYTSGDWHDEALYPQKNKGRVTFVEQGIQSPSSKTRKINEQSKSTWNKAS